VLTYASIWVKIPKLITVYSSVCIAITRSRGIPKVVYPDDDRHYFDESCFNVSNAPDSPSAAPSSSLSHPVVALHQVKTSLCQTCLQYSVVYKNVVC
jgi:hypothetical protein